MVTQEAAEIVSRRFVTKETSGLYVCDRFWPKAQNFLRSTISPALGQGGVTLTHVCLHWNPFPVERYNKRGNTSSKKMQRSWRCAVRGRQHDRRNKERVLLMQAGVPGRQKVLRAHVSPSVSPPSDLHPSGRSGDPI